MKIATVILGLAILAEGAGAQPAPKPTEIRGLQVGMPFSSFEKLANPAAACPPHAPSCFRHVQEVEAGELNSFAYQGATVWFSKGILVEIDLTFDNFDEFMTAAITKFGKPSTSETIPVENAFGVKFQVKTATWNMPDGAVIDANESTAFSDNGKTFVTVQNAEWYALAHPKREAPKL